MNYVIGIDLGTSAVKLLLVDQNGEIASEVSKSYPLIQEKNGYSEQDPDVWVEETLAGLKELVQQAPCSSSEIEAISFSGQMHGLVLLDKEGKPLRNAILWNDTRTTKQCRDIIQQVGEKRLLEITKNPALEGFTLPKVLWVKENEPELYKEASVFVLPKDYLRYRLTDELAMDYSDAAGTLLLDLSGNKWSQEVCDAVGIDVGICPPLVDSSEQTGFLGNKAADQTGLRTQTKVFAGGADNACGAIGSGILTDGKTLCSIGTSGVLLSYEASRDKDFEGKVHYFNHGAPEAYYTMGVTLAAGDSLRWFKDVYAPQESFADFAQGVEEVPVGSRGLLFTPYISGERTPHADANIRGSFIGMNHSHTRKDFVHAIMEGITFSLNESLEIFRENGKTIDTIVSTGGGTKNEYWLQMQADIFNAEVVKLSSEQGPGVGAAMLAAYGCGWFDTLEDCADAFLTVEKTFSPDGEKVEQYQALFKIYQDVYGQTKTLNERLQSFR
ncbi:xylulokinase [Halobacillus karajensis]|uniref:Xylulose kinase n=1 Tax=Halobacillus karajensis TaxID=195088 RepID=A0A024P378_9BACI|nr:xylulokinase [Halobacillus karajensis]CDQ19117.1 Xylulose kinase [Halobacillus karajensis]CDQ22809.1 Xylulose kinase [Halobacillus karajensis]CDQ26291.1 Xylulose kinase [Halobacillus karajensis]SEH41337.1 xylulokinase [Halobacillus karajensis]